MASQEQSLSSRSNYAKVFETRVEDIYKLDPTGTTYVAPALLCGVPVDKITEASPYWESSWTSLDEFMAREEQERALKEQFMAMKDREPENRAIKQKAKLHQDNMSKHVKIREIFGSHSTYHPNQIVSKRHMPPEGLCGKELMYRLACRVSDLKILNDKQILSMDAWDFLRWRVGLKVQEHLAHPGKNGSGNVRTIIYKLGDNSEAGDPMSYEDPVVREAVLISAGFQNRLSSFHTKTSKLQVPPQLYRAFVPARPSAQTQRSRQPRRRIGTTRDKRAALANEEARKERRRQLSARSGGYQGVNAFRAQAGSV